MCVVYVIILTLATKLLYIPIAFNEITQMKNKGVHVWSHILGAVTDVEFSQVHK